MTVAMSTALVRGTQEQGESFGEKLKKFFVRPKPTLKHRKRNPRFRSEVIQRESFGSGRSSSARMVGKGVGVDVDPAAVAALAEEALAGGGCPRFCQTCSDSAARPS